MEKRKAKNQENFSRWLDFFWSKQSDHLNAMVGVGISLVFGLFSIPESKKHVLLPFLALILVIFLHFYGKYYDYYLYDVIVRVTMNLERNCCLEKTLEKYNVILSPEDYFWERISEDWFKNYSQKAQKKVLWGFPFLIYNSGKRVELSLCGIFGIVVLLLIFF